GCDVVLVCHPELVEESLAAVANRSLNTRALVGLLGRGALGWDGLLADARYGGAQARLAARMGQMARTYRSSRKSWMRPNCCSTARSPRMRSRPSPTRSIPTTATT